MGWDEYCDLTLILLNGTNTFDDANSRILLIRKSPKIKAAVLIKSDDYVSFIKKEGKF